MTDELKTRILGAVDHTLLKAFATWEQIEKLCTEALKYKTASVCIPPSYVARVRKTFGDTLKVCTVIGFPLGYSTTETKIFEALDAVNNGADEIDIVINIADVKNKDFDKIETELQAVRAVSKDRVFKVIIETCYLDEAEKIKMCEIVTRVKADFIKTSTGFGTPGDGRAAGATLEDIELFKKHIGPNVKIKASGGMKTAEDHEKFFNAGAARLGTSSAISALCP